MNSPHGGVHNVYDKSVHWNASFVMMGGVAASQIEFNRHKCPGKPEQVPGEELKETLFAATGTNGVWNSHFEPVSDFVPRNDPSCQGKPLIHLSDSGLLELNAHAPWVVIPCPSMMPSFKFQMAQTAASSVHDWCANRQQKGHEMVKKHCQFRPQCLEQAEKVNPTNNNDNTSKPCLAMHVRHSDKEDVKGRETIPTDNFFPCASVFFQESNGNTIYLATDSMLVLEQVGKWPFALIIHFQ